MKTAIIATMLLLVTACAQEPVKCDSFHFHKSFPTEFKSAAMTAAAKWSTFSGNTVTIEAGDPNDESCSLRIITSDSEDYINYKSVVGVDFNGLHDPANGSIFLVPDRYYANWFCNQDTQACAQGILMHEFAHSCGMDHVEDPSAVMGTTALETRTEFNDSDKKECERVGACKTWKQ